MKCYQCQADKRLANSTYVDSYGVSLVPIANSLLSSTVCATDSVGYS